jgi:DNA invertase Pin-like site-specific DNA recombinase
MTKITPEHLARTAFIYVRQSTADQLLHNHESRQRQYGLQDRARQLGWHDVTVIDDDLGRSGSGVGRPGFERLLAAICEGRAGAVFAIEASRLARNGRDWHTLIDFCGLVDTIIVDEDGVYDARHPNDRMLLGMKGTMSELELSIFRQRSMEALKQKARRGELFLTVAIGYVKVGDNRIEKDPDQRVCTAVALVFRKFSELGSVRQVHLWFRHEGIVLPAVNHTVEGRSIVWKLPVYNTIHHMLTNPIYAGAYVFGRTGSRVTIEAGRKRIVRGFKRERAEWEVLIEDHHEGYLSWDEFERNRRVITDNANSKTPMVRGSVRRGETLLAGLLRCGHCGRNLHVAYGGTGGDIGRYHCRGSAVNHGGDPCISFGSLRVDQAVSAEVIRVLKPLGIEAALAAIEVRKSQGAEKRSQIEMALKQARYEASLARRQYDAVDPDNRLVAGELERRWNAKLVEAHRLEEELAAFDQQRPMILGEEERGRLLRLGTDLEVAWSHPAATMTTRKRIVRAVLNEIVVRVEASFIDMVLHWRGGDHTALKVKKNTTGKHRWAVEEDTEVLVRDLARMMPDRAIAAILNRTGKVTGRNNGWTEGRVRSLRSRMGVPVYREGERAERGELNLVEAATVLHVSTMTVLRMIRIGVLHARQLCKGAPWAIKASDLDKDAVRAEARGRRQKPRTQNPDQENFSFQ